jgi:hypothetical protein
MLTTITSESLSLFLSYVHMSLAFLSAFARIAAW